MSEDHVVQGPDVQKVLEVAVARHLEVELHIYDDSGDLSVTQTQLMPIEGNHLVVVQRVPTQQEVPYAQGQDIECYVKVDEPLYYFQSHIRSIRSKTAQDGRTRVDALILTQPKTLEQRQRRNTFRVSLASLGEIRVEFYEIHTLEPMCCPINPLPLTGKLVNVSEGGIGVRVEAIWCPEFEMGRPYIAEFTLPGDDTPLWYVTEYRHDQTILNGNAAILGFKLLDWPDKRDLQQRLRPLVKLHSDIQRRQTANLKRASA